MKLNLFKRNKNARTTPMFIRDARSAIDCITQRDSISFACIDRIANAIAGLSFGIYDKKSHKKVEHNLYDVLKEPNKDETHSLFFYQLVKDYYNGNIYLYKYTDENGEIISLFRLNPAHVNVSRDEYNRKTYSYNGKTYYSNDILHIPSRFGYDGKIGHSIFVEANKAFDTASSLETYTDNTFNNNLGKRLIIDIEKAYPDASDEDMAEIRQKYIDTYGGVKNASKPIVKSGKINFETIDTGTSNNQTNQLTESKEYQTKVISLMFGIPPQMLIGGAMDLETTTTLYLSNAIEPIVKAFEESFQKLFNISDKERFYIEFNRNSVMRTSLLQKIDSYTKQINYGLLTPNEVRAKENLSSIEAGDCSFIPANLMPLTKENIDAYMAKSKIEIENAEQAETSNGVGSDKR